MMSEKIHSTTEFVTPICPDCGYNTVGNLVACPSCGWKLPFAFIIPYESLWGFETELVQLLLQYDSLRLMGRLKGKDPNKLRLLSHAKYLHLSRYPIGDNQFDQFDRLEVLELDCSKVNSLGSIAACANLKSLSLIECKIHDDFTVLTRCRKLRVLDLSLSKFESVKGLEQLDQLIYFRIEGGRMDSLHFLSSMRNLKTLIINTKVLDKSLSSIMNLELERLVIKRGNFSKIEIAQFKENCSSCSILIH